MEAPPSSRGPSPTTDLLDTENKGRVLSWEQLSRYEGFVIEGVEAGVANSLAMVIAHTQQVFLLTPGEDSKLKVSERGGLQTQRVRESEGPWEDSIVGVVD